jgi:hypothetical protein
MRVMAFPVLVLLTGLILVAFGASSPRMLNPDWQLAVKEGDSDSYFREFERNLSPQARRYDLGVGLASAGASMLVLIAVTRSWSVQRLRTLKTPRRRWPVVILSNAAWFYYIWATTQYLILQARRDEFPPWADSIAIPMAGLGMSLIFGFIVINIGLAVYLYGAKLPASMWTRPRTVRSWVLNAGVAVALLGCAWAGCDAVRFGDAFSPPAVVAVSYLLLVGRASACAA